MMLNKNPLSRLSKFSHIKSHPWFANFSWDNLISLDVHPPFIPKLKAKDDENNMIPYVSYIKVFEIIYKLL